VCLNTSTVYLNIKNKKIKKKKKKKKKPLTRGSDVQILATTVSKEV
jgi:hypothetical protein